MVGQDPDRTTSPASFGQSELIEILIAGRSVAEGTAAPSFGSQCATAHTYTITMCLRVNGNVNDRLLAHALDHETRWHPE